MRTQEQILERIKAIEQDDFLNFKQEVLVMHLTFENAKPFLTPDTDAAKWNPEPTDPDSVLKQAAKYMEFAWEKTLNHRGLSANRSILKLTEFVWLLEEDLLIADIDRTNYPQYGAPILRLVCDRLGLSMPDTKEALRMSQGEPCVPGCDEGCGS